MALLLLSASRISLSTEFSRNIVASHILCFSEQLACMNIYMYIEIMLVYLLGVADYEASYRHQ